MENVQWEIYNLMFGLCGIVVNGHNRKETIIKNKK